MSQNQPAPMDTITATAPAKLVLSGEYAVLAGGPAIVAAMNRRVEATLSIARSGDWSFTSSLSSQPHSTTLAQILTGPLPGSNHPAFLPTQVVRALNDTIENAAWPHHIQVSMDTSALFDENGSKLGLGSSAALCTALAGAFTNLLRTKLSLADIVAIHRRCQGGKGSGLDVAAALHGKIIQYRLAAGRDPTSSPFTASADLHFSYYWTGVSASTSVYLDRLSNWLVQSPNTPMHVLVDAAEAVVSGGFSIADLNRFAAALHALDDAAELGIYAGVHESLHALAKGHEVVYKPCGAGGGDLGLAVSTDSNALDAYTKAALGMGVRTIALETDPHGLIVHRS